jgi:hypothetical protein
MEKLAAALAKDELAAKAYALYEKFRPQIPSRHDRLGREGRAGSRGR